MFLEIISQIIFDVNDVFVFFFFLILGSFSKMSNLLDQRIFIFGDPIYGSTALWSPFSCQILSKYISFMEYIILRK